MAGKMHLQQLKKANRWNGYYDGKLEHIATVINCLQNKNLSLVTDRLSSHRTGFKCLLRVCGLKCTGLSTLIVNV